MAGCRRDVGEGPNGGGLIGPNPTDRAKNGTKKSLLVERDGGPLGMVIAAANVNDITLLAATLDAVIVERPQPAPDAVQHLCLDRGYASATGRTVAAARNYELHLPHGTDEAHEALHPARRWVVERTLAWLSKCRALLIRWDKHSGNYLTLLQLACALLWYRRCYRLTQF